MDRIVPDIWLGGRSADENTQVLANRQVQFYVSELLQQNPYPNLVEDSAALKQAQDYLLSMKGAETLLRNLISQAKSAKRRRRSREVRSQSQGRSHRRREDGSCLHQGRLGFHSETNPRRQGGLSGRYLRYRRAEHRCSLLKNAETIKDLQNLYVKEYIKRWQGFLQSEGVARYRNIGDAADKLRFNPIIIVLPCWRWSS